MFQVGPNMKALDQSEVRAIFTQIKEHFFLLFLGIGWWVLDCYVHFFVGVGFEIELHYSHPILSTLCLVVCIWIGILPLSINLSIYLSQQAGSRSQRNNNLKHRNVAEIRNQRNETNQLCPQPVAIELFNSRFPRKPMAMQSHL